MKLDTSSLEKSVASLRRAVDYSAEKIDFSGDSVQAEVLRAGVIQNFEFTYELCWKFMKRWLEYNVGKSEVDGVPRRELFRVAAENGLIEEVETWMRFHSARNQTSHLYDPEISREVFAITLSFAEEAEKFFKVLVSKNA